MKRNLQSTVVRCLSTVHKLEESGNGVSSRASRLLSQQHKEKYDETHSLGKTKSHGPAFPSRQPQRPPSTPRQHQHDRKVCESNEKQLHRHKLLELVKNIQQLGVDKKWAEVVDELRSADPKLVTERVLDSAIVALSGRKEGGRELIRMVRLKGITLNSRNLTTAMKYCGWKEAEELLREETDLYKLKVEIRCYNSLFHKLAKARQLARCRALMSQMQAVGLGSQINIIHYNVLLDLIAKTGAGGEAALDVLKEVKAKGLPPDVKTYSSCMAALGEGDHVLEQALELWLEMETANIAPDMFAYSTMIRLYNKQFQECLSLLESMKRLGMKPNLVVYNCVLHALSLKGQISLARKLLAEMVRVGVKPDLKSHNSMMNCFAVAKLWQSALDYVKEIKELGFQPDAVTYGSLIHAAAKANKWEVCIQVLDTMLSEGIEVTLPCYTAVLHGLAEGKQWQRAVELIQFMKSRNVDPCIRAYTCVITALGHSGMYKDALALHKVIREEGLVLDEIAYGATIHACSVGGAWDICLDLLQEMKDFGLVPSSSMYLSAIEACKNAHMTEMAVFLHREMQRNCTHLDVEPITYSVVETDTPGPRFFT